MHLSLNKKLFITVAIAVSAMIGTIFIASTWAANLAEIVHPVFAWIVVIAIAILPGFSYWLFFVGLVFDDRPQYEKQETLPDISILIAMYNEQDAIKDTISSILEQEYPGKVTIIPVDDGSTDDTRQTVSRFVEEFNRAKPVMESLTNFEITPISYDENGGKAKALNVGLQQVQTDLFITIDADTYLYKDAIQHLVTNLVCGPEETIAVAGTMLVRNSRKSLMTKIQEWDYFHGIGVIKRIQSMFGGALVAQGAFSVYNTEAVRELGGWDVTTVGEDIVLTWGLRNNGYRVGYAENAFAFTNVPTTYRSFLKQRIRWSKGLIEAFKKHPKTLIDIRKNSIFIWINFTFPYTDLILGTVFVPGVIAALFFQWYAIAGIMTLMLLPLAIAINLLMYSKQSQIFDKYGLQIRHNTLGLIIYVALYHIVVVPASIIGYYAEIFSLKKNWGTK